MWNGVYLYYEPDCDGAGTYPGGWLLDNDEPSTTAAGDLDQNGYCSPGFAYAFDYSATWGMYPPSTTWVMWCASGRTYANLTIARARVPVVGTLVGMSGLDCSGFSDSIFTHAGTSSRTRR